MKRLTLFPALLVVAALAIVGLVAVVVADDGPRRAGMGPGMMAPPGYSGVCGDDDSGGWMMGSRRGPMMGSWMGPMMGFERGSMMGSWWAADEPAYLAEMVAHHQEAVTAAEELARSDRPQLRAFGESIVTTQSLQIAQMTSWLAAWYPDQPDADDYDPMMRDLSGLVGDQLDRTFLEDMITHHMAAVMMSQHLLLRGTEHDQVTVLARSIRDDQHIEIIQMQQWLAQWYDADWRDPRGWGRGPGPCLRSGMRY